ncbi:hypothetical protein L211DRAFT_852268 [Terfezia boudieri ATCC MYA-4762]|uniref:Uncharacterized protein n=1 Tax=Terfezia boudieri ATCC MYA-4762 TaxID=1051890 RepID=A0A3N4LCF3_9PEZI|nr:hypothetical protein L211DRAFT_852268 [Terfezia boudieri ATCC MYA-4762]
MASEFLVPPPPSIPGNSNPHRVSQRPRRPLYLAALLENAVPPIVSQNLTRPPSPATPQLSRLTLPSIFYLLHIVPYLRVYRLSQGPCIENNFHGLFLLLWSLNIQLRLVHPPWMVTAESDFYGWEWAVTRWALEWHMWILSNVGPMGWFRKIMRKMIVASDDKEAPVSPFEGRDISKLFGTAGAPGPAEPWVVAAAEVVALVVVWIPAMWFLGLWSGDSNLGLIHAVLNVFALWMDVYYRRGYFSSYLGESMPGPALQLEVLMERWTSDVLKVIIAYGILRSLCRAIEGGWRGYTVLKEGGFGIHTQGEEELHRIFEQEGVDERAALTESSEFGEFVSAATGDGVISKEQEESLTGEDGGQDPDGQDPEEKRWMREIERGWREMPPPLLLSRKSSPPRQTQPIPSPQPPPEAEVLEKSSEFEEFMNAATGDGVIIKQQEESLTGEDDPEEEKWKRETERELREMPPPLLPNLQRSPPRQTQPTPPSQPLPDGEVLENPPLLPPSLYPEGEVLESPPPFLPSLQRSSLRQIQPTPPSQAPPEGEVLEKSSEFEEFVSAATGDGVISKEQEESLTGEDDPEEERWKKETERELREMPPPLLPNLQRSPPRQTQPTPPSQPLPDGEVLENPPLLPPSLYPEGEVLESPPRLARSLQRSPARQTQPTPSSQAPPEREVLEKSSEFEEFVSAAAGDGVISKEQEESLTAEDDPEEERWKRETERELREMPPPLLPSRKSSPPRQIQPTPPSQAPPEGEVLEKSSEFEEFVSAATGDGVISKEQEESLTGEDDPEEERWKRETERELREMPPPLLPNLQRSPPRQTQPTPPSQPPPDGEVLEKSSEFEEVSAATGDGVISKEQEESLTGEDDPEEERWKRETERELRERELREMPPPLLPNLQRSPPRQTQPTPPSQPPPDGEVLEKSSEFEEVSAATGDGVISKEQEESLTGEDDPEEERWKRETERELREMPPPLLTSRKSSPPRQIQPTPSPQPPPEAEVLESPPPFLPSLQRSSPRQIQPTPPSQAPPEGEVLEKSSEFEEFVSAATGDGVISKEQEESLTGEDGPEEERWKRETERELREMPPPSFPISSEVPP